MTFLQELVDLDEETCRRVLSVGCLHCGGPLHRADYPRKPRGGLFAEAGEVFTRRLSLCCGWPGCRRRATPPSVRFLGRRVYLGVSVLLAGVAAQLLSTARAVRRQTGIAPRTVRRWAEWWRGAFIESRLFQQQRARFVPPLSESSLPRSLVERFAQGVDPLRPLRLALVFLAPLTTTSVTDGHAG